MTELWKTIDNYDSYSVSSEGRVRNDATGRFLKGRFYSKGYLQVGLTIDGERNNHYIHRLVAIAFIPNPECKPFVDHHDNNPANNSLENLRWATCSENSRNQRIHCNNTSGVKGVSWYKRYQKWQATIKIDGIVIHIGYYDTLEEATLARQTRAQEAFGIFLNACETPK